MSDRDLIIEQIEVLTAEKKQFDEKRAKAIAKYDRAPDGSEAKQEAIMSMDRLGEIISGYEGQLSELADALEDN